MITYQIDFTEKEYRTIQGNCRELLELKKLLFPEEAFLDCLGYLYTDADPEASLCLAAIKEYGTFLGYKKKIQNTFMVQLSLYQKELLDEVVDVWGDGLEISIGLFLPPQLAWNGICAFADSGRLYHGIQWIGEEEIPEGGNYVI